MNAILALAARDLRRSFRTPVAFAVLGLYLVVHGIYFASLMEQYSQISLQAIAQGQADEGINLTDRMVQPLIMADTFLLLLLLPGITMRLMAEEWRSGTSDLLLSYPLREIDIVLGKFLSAAALLAMMVGLGLLHPLAAEFFGDLESGTIVMQQLGILLFGLCCIAIGLAFSCFTENQVIAFGLTVVVLFSSWFLGWWGGVLDPPWGVIVSWISLPYHINPFSFGVFRLSNTVYFLGTTAFWLFLAVGVLEARRWRGASR